MITKSTVVFDRVIESMGRIPDRFVCNFFCYILLNLIAMFVEREGRYLRTAMRVNQFLMLHFNTMLKRKLDLGVASLILKIDACPVQATDVDN